MKNLIKLIFVACLLLGFQNSNAQNLKIIISKDTTGKEIITGLVSPNYQIGGFVRNKLKNPTYYLFIVSKNNSDSVRFFSAKLGKTMTEGKLIEYMGIRDGGAIIETSLGTFEFPGFPDEDGPIWRHFQDGTKQEVVNLLI